jgi:hypothetical protein
MDTPAAGNQHNMFGPLREALFQGTDPASSDVEELRAMLPGAADHQSLGIWRRLRALGVMPSPSEAAEVLGVVAEIGTENGAAVVFGMRDGDASMYFSSGGGHIGGGGQPHINAAARRLAKVAAGVVEALPLVDEHPLPAAGRVRISILTPAGVRAADEDPAELARGGHPLSPVFAGANNIITGFRKQEQPDPNDERYYANCMLTVLARGDVHQAVLVAGTPPPDLAAFTSNEKDLEWIARFAFALDRLDTGKIISTLAGLVGLRWYHWPSATRTFSPKLASQQGEMEDVSFLIVRTRDKGQTRMEVRRTQAPPSAAR